MACSTHLSSGRTASAGPGSCRFPVMLHAALSRLTDEYLVSGKLLAAATMLAVCRRDVRGAASERLSGANRCSVWSAWC